MYSTLQSPRKKKQKKRKAVIISVAVIFALGLSFWGIIRFFSHPSFQILKITVLGTKLVSEEAVKRAAEASLSGNYYYFFPKKNYLVYPKEEILGNILSSFPPIETARLSIGDSRELIISISERTAAAIWCGKDKPASDVIPNSGCFYLDKEGYLFGVSPRFSGDAYFTLYGYQTLSNGKLVGQHLIPPAVFKKALELRDFLLKRHIGANSIYFGKEHYAEFIDSKGFIVKWNTDQDISALESNMQAVFRSPTWKDGVYFPNSGGSEVLEYFDFRFGNKIFYKEKGVEEPSLPITLPDVVVSGSSTPETVSTEPITN
jgi:hypothetical protein